MHRDIHEFRTPELSVTVPCRARAPLRLPAACKLLAPAAAAAALAPAPQPEL